MEDFIFEKIEKKKPQRLSNIEHLGLDMIEAGKDKLFSSSKENFLTNHSKGGDFGCDGAYGAALIKTGQTEQKLGQIERDFIANAGISFIQPLRK